MTDMDLDLTTSNLAVLAEHALQRLGERKSLVFDDQEITNAQTLDLARRIHRRLQDRGFGKGDIAALCMINHPKVYPCFQGIFRTGGAAVPVMAQLTASDLRYVLEDTSAKCVVTDQANLSKVREATKGLGSVEFVVVRGGDPSDLRDGELDLQDWLTSEPQNELPPIDVGDLAMLLYTSGTTGRPKGAMLSHGNLLASARQASAAGEVERLEHPRVTVSAMPMAHIFGVGVMNGGYLVPERLADGYMVQLAWFEPERFMQMIQEHRAATFPSVPTMLALMLNHPKIDDYDLSSVEEVVCGAAPLPVELARAFAERYGCRIREIYGMTESCGLGSANRVSEPYKPGSAGRAYSETDLKIFGAGGEELPVGERGEVVLRGPSVMMGYLNRPEATAETIKNGWLHTGDVGYLDEEGSLFIVDRMKDMIIRGGENIYPAELEDVLYQHPAVAEAAVVGVPDDVYGEGVVAYVAVKAGHDTSEAELISWVKEKTTPFKAPQKVNFIDALPKSGVGKILRRELRDSASKNSTSKNSASKKE